MRNIITSAVFLGVIGLVAGYFLFGKVGNSYIGLTELINPGDSLLSQLGSKLKGVESIRQNILLSGSVGAIVGAVFGVVRSR